MQKLAVIGVQWGDEGKGKIVDLLGPRCDLVVRYQEGANAGHTIIAQGEKVVLHLIPLGYPTGQLRLGHRPWGGL